jgi:hypothetical protein
MEQCRSSSDNHLKEMMMVHTKDQDKLHQIMQKRRRNTLDMKERFSM